MRCCNEQRSKAPSQRKSRRPAAPGCSVTPLAAGVVRLELSTLLPAGVESEPVRSCTQGFALGLWARFGEGEHIQLETIQFVRTGRRLAIAFDTQAEARHTSLIRDIGESFARSLQNPERWRPRPGEGKRITFTRKPLPGGESR